MPETPPTIAARILWDAPPYRAWLLNPARGWPWGISGAGGWNCYGGAGGNVFLPSREVAERIIRESGHEPGPVRHV